MLSFHPHFLVNLILNDIHYEHLLKLSKKGSKGSLSLLKEVFYRFMASKDKQEAAIKLKEFRMHAFVADIPEFNACLTMLKNWEPYILNAFTRTYFNGFTECISNTIKVIKRIAYGYPNFDNFKLRILHTLQIYKEPTNC